MDILTPEQQEKFKALKKDFEKNRWPKTQVGEHGQMSIHE
jgi:Spy/CpxP family protein refolding chaperone